jgi:predicted aldo/keto reductase-like oxidoreductase
MNKRMIERQLFGRTDHMSTRAIFGGAALSHVTQADADRVLELLLDYGVNHIDTAASYGDSELRIGAWMQRYRDDFFLATKTEERTYQQARDEFQRSLERLRVDQVDLLQLHNLVDPKEWEVAMGPGGVLEAVIEAQEQGLVRFIGVTGHSTHVTAMHQHSLKRFDFDSVLLPYNYMIMQNPQYAAGFKAVMGLTQDTNAAIQTIKAIARGPWGGKSATYNTWYKPLEDQADIDKAVHWVLSCPGIFMNTVADIQLLPKVLEAASNFQSEPSEEEMREMATRLEMVPLFI